MVARAVRTGMSVSVSGWGQTLGTVLGGGQTRDQTLGTVPDGGQTPGQTLVRALFLTLVLGGGLTLPAASQAQDAATVAETTFKWVAATLRSLDREGALPATLALPDGRQDVFIALLREAYAGYTRGIAPNDPFCRYFLDPENGRVELEDRATRGFGLLPPLADRLRHFAEVTEALRTGVIAQVGGETWTAIEAQRRSAVSFEYLPVWALDAAERVHFADTACGR